MRKSTPSLAGSKFGKLTVIEEFRKRSGKQSILYCRCECECGEEYVVQKSRFKGENKPQSCSCHRTMDGRKFFKTGQSQSATYKSWSAMRYRCFSPKAVGYENYGGRGIKVCSRWNKSFENFLKDMGERPEGLTLDRINNNGNYTPKNCRWATKSEQQSNKRKYTHKKSLRKSGAAI